MEKVVWKGTFAEAEERDHQFWASQTPEYRLKTLLDIREMLYPDASPRMEKVAFIRKWEMKKKNDKGPILFEDFIQLCNQYELRYFVIGGFAGSIHGYPRGTKDLDICIEASEELG